MKETNIQTIKRLKHYLSGHFHIVVISQIKDKHFVDSYAIKSRGKLFTAPSGKYKFKTKDEAIENIKPIKQSIFNHIKKLQNKSRN